MTRENAIREMLLAAQTLADRGEKKQSIELINKVLRIDFGCIEAWRLLYSLYDVKLPFNEFCRKYADHFYPGRAHRLPDLTTKNPSQPDHEGNIEKPVGPSSHVRQTQPTSANAPMDTRQPETTLPPDRFSQSAVKLLQCPLCKRNNLPDARLCAYCGCNFYPQPAPAAHQLPSPQVQPAPEPRRFRLHFIDFADVVMIVSLFLPWASIEKDTFLGGSTNYYDILGVIRMFDGDARVNIAVILFLLLGLGASALVRARLKPVAILAALGAVAAQIYTMAAFDGISGKESGFGGMFYNITIVTMREGVTVGLIGAGLILLGVLYYEKNFFTATAVFIKRTWWFFLIVFLLSTCALTAFYLQTQMMVAKYQAESKQKATLSSQSTFEAVTTREAAKHSTQAVSQSQTSVAVTQTSAVMQGAPWSNRVAYIKGGGTNSDVYVARLNGFDNNFVTSNGRNKYVVRWSPDGSRLAYIGVDMGHASHVYVVGVHGGDPETLALSDQRSLSWAPDGQHIYYVQNVSGEYRLRLKMVGEKSSIEVTASRRYTFNNLAASPDGKTLAFSSRCNESTGVCLYYFDLNSQKIETDPFADDPPSFHSLSNLAWSPDSQRLVFQSGADEDGYIYIMNRDGSGLTQLSEQAGFSPSWCRDGEWITFAAAGNPDQVLAVRSDGSQEIRTQVITPIYHSVVCDAP